MGIGATIFAASLFAYPRRAVLPTPVGGQLQIFSQTPYVNRHMGFINETVQQYSRGKYKGEADVTIRVLLPALHPDMPPGANIQISLSQMPHIIRCAPSCNITHDKLGDLATAVTSFSRHNTVAVIAAFAVKSSSFGVAANGATAAVALPRVYTTATRPEQLTLIIPVPSAASYDWSAYPPNDLTTTGDATWSEPIVPGDVPPVYGGSVTPARVVPGVNNAAQQSDSVKILFIGVVLGLGASAIIAAIQMALED
jgi:hypothetical protein